MVLGLEDEGAGAAAGLVFGRLAVASGSTKGTKASLLVMLEADLAFDEDDDALAILDLPLSAGVESESRPGSTKGVNAALGLDVDDDAAVLEAGALVVVLDKDAVAVVVLVLPLSFIRAVSSSWKGTNAALSVAFDDEPTPLAFLVSFSAGPSSLSSSSTSSFNTSPDPDPDPRSGSLKICNLGPSVLAAAALVPAPLELLPALTGNVVPLIFFTSGTFSFTLDILVPSSAQGVGVTGSGGSFSPSWSWVAVGVPGAGSWNIWRRALGGVGGEDEEVLRACVGPEVVVEVAGAAACCAVRDERVIVRGPPLAVLEALVPGFRDASANTARLFGCGWVCGVEESSLLVGSG